MLACGLASAGSSSALPAQGRVQGWLESGMQRGAAAGGLPAGHGGMARPEAWGVPPPRHQWRQGSLPSMQGAPPMHTGQVGHVLLLLLLLQIRGGFVDNPRPMLYMPTHTQKTQSPPPTTVSDDLRAILERLQATHEPMQHAAAAAHNMSPRSYARAVTELEAPLGNPFAGHRDPAGATAVHGTPFMSGLQVRVVFVIPNASTVATAHPASRRNAATLQRALHSLGWHPSRRPCEVGHPSRLPADPALCSSPRLTPDFSPRSTPSCNGMHSSLLTTLGILQFCIMMYQWPGAYVHTVQVVH